jgi:hypothetical protein
MPILNNIPRKPNIIPTGGDKSFDLSRQQHIPNGFDGLTYQSPFTPDSVTNVDHHNNATIVQVIAMQVEQPGIVVPAQLFIRIHPQNKTTLNRANKIMPIVKRVGGPSPTSNTPFHPKPHPIYKREPRFSSLTTDSYHTAAAVVTSQLQTNVPHTPKGAPIHPVGSFIQHSNQTLSSHTHSDLNVSRWSTIKKGAAG